MQMPEGMQVEQQGALLGAGAEEQKEFHGREKEAGREVES
jgi:hypothetical protein